MTDEEKKNLYEKSSLKTHNVKITTTNPELKNKIRSTITEETDTIFWYIKFNVALDAESVSKKTMNVTERNGYIVKTDISYEAKNNLISICPIDCYAQNEYYLLNISKKVRSEKGKRLKREIHVMFKIVGNQISEYKILSSSTEVPKPKKRPKNYVPQGELVYPKSSVTKAYTFDQAKFEKLAAHDRLPYEMPRINPLISIAGLIAAIVGIFLPNFIVLIAGAVISLVGVVHIIIQFSKKTMRATMLYNTGVMFFNRGNYKKARKQFIRAVMADENNEYAEFASAKVEFYV